MTWVTPSSCATEQLHKRVDVAEADRPIAVDVAILVGTVRIEQLVLRWRRQPEHERVDIVKPDAAVAIQIAHDANGQYGRIAGDRACGVRHDHVVVARVRTVDPLDRQRVGGGPADAAAVEQRKKTP